jgi:glycosyltransferase involved in cell wall biosynthesis
MKDGHPSKVLITGGRETGGVASFAEALRAGFSELGIPAEIVPPGHVFRRWREMRNPQVLKILSTTAVFAAPLARRAVCVAHGFPRADVQGWFRLLAIFASYKVAGVRSQLVAVSHYTAVHLRTIFNLRVDAVIHNPLNGLFFDAHDGNESLTESLNESPGDCIAYVGRLHPAKGLERILPAICALLRERPDLRACIIGDGELRPALEVASAGNERIEFTGRLSQPEVRARLRRSRVFISACETEALGISYLEALSQGCAVVMPACGGGVEIAPELIGSRIHLFSASSASEPIANALRRALLAAPQTVSLAAFSPRAVAQAYLDVDGRQHAHSIPVVEAGRRSAAI